MDETSLPSLFGPIIPIGKRQIRLLLKIPEQRVIEGCNNAVYLQDLAGADFSDEKSFET